MPRLKRLKFESLAERGFKQWALNNPSAIAVDTETEGVGFYDQPFCATVAWDIGHGVQSHYFEMDGVNPDYLKVILEQTPKLVFHNAKFDLQKLILSGHIDRGRLSGERIEDTECLAHMTNEHWDKHLKVLARNLLGEETDEASVVKKAREKVKKELGIQYLEDVGFHMIPREVIYPYALKDAEFTYRLWKFLLPGIGRYSELVSLYEREMELCLAVLDMEAAGMGVRVDYVKDKLKFYNRKVLEEELQIGDLTGMPVWYPERKGQKTPEGRLNVNSSQQLLAQLNAGGTTVTATNKEALREVLETSPLARAVVSLRNDKKNRDTYIKGILKEQRDGIIHPWFNINRVVSGRFSSSEASDG